MSPDGSRVVYTCNFGSYDTLHPISGDWKGDFICFTDNPALDGKGWRIQLVEGESGESPAMLSRRYKILVHRYLPAFAETLYLDANVQLLQDPTFLFEKYASGFFFAPAHRERDCAYMESEALLNTNSLSHETMRDISSQMSRYEAAGFPRRMGMSENSVLLRRRSGELDRLMERWWHEFTSGCGRDQVSLPYAMWVEGLSFGEIAESPRGPQRLFQVHLHDRQKKVNALLRVVRLARLRRWQAWHYGFAAGLGDLAGSLVRRFLKRG